MEFDPFLYVAFLVGLVLGRLVRPNTPWVGRATLLTVGVLVGLLGASLAAVPVPQLIATIPLSLGFVALILGFTIAAHLLVTRASPPPQAPTAPTAPGGGGQLPISLLLLAALLGGYALGRLVSVPTGTALPWALYVLLALVAFDLKLRVDGLRRLWVPLTAAVTGSVAAAEMFIVLTGTSAPAALATAFAFGWYTLAGPLVGARAGALLGLLAFSTNFLREDLTMLLSPILGRRLRGEGLAAMGGATSMDTTLYFVTRYGATEAASLSLASGLVLTVAASLLLPLLLSLP
ncbi:MAG: lysine exporter LysO family protein [Thermoplasmata archaeon]|nr:lysine exporter LysO family protein [Thermoplasmata archaeon]